MAAILLVLPEVLSFLGESVFANGLRQFGFSAGSAVIETLSGAGAIDASLVTGSGLVVDAGVGAGLITETGVGAGLITETGVGTTSGVISTTEGVLSELAGTTGVIDESILIPPSNLIALDTTEFVEGSAVLDVEAQLSVSERLEASLSTLGVTREGIGEITWGKWAIGLSTGALTTDDILKSINLNPSEFVNDTLNALIGDYDANTDISHFIVYDKFGNIIDPEELSIGDFDVDDPYKIGFDALTLIANSAVDSSFNTGLPRDQAGLISLLTTAVANPEKAYMTKHIIDFYKSDSYKKHKNEISNYYRLVGSVYTGKIDNVFETPEGLFGLIDETGKEQIYRGSRGVVDIGATELRMPTLYKGAVYTGPFSPNDRLPRGFSKEDIQHNNEILNGNGLLNNQEILEYQEFLKKQNNDGILIEKDFLDLFCMNHDLIYEEDGFFSPRGDTLLVSRIQSRFEENPNFFGDLDQTAKFVHFWFSKVSPVLSTIYGAKGGLDPNQFLDGDTTGFFDYFINTKYKSNKIDNNLGFLHPARRAQVLIHDNARKQFELGGISAINIVFETTRLKFIIGQTANALGKITIN